MSGQGKYIDLVLLNKLIDGLREVFIVNQLTIETGIRIFLTQSLTHSFKHRFIEFMIIPLINMQTDQLRFEGAQQADQLIDCNKIDCLKIGRINNGYKIS